MVDTESVRPCLVVACAVVAVIGAACSGGSNGGRVEPPSDPYPGREQSLSGVLLRELEVEVLEGYDLPTFETAVPATAVSSRVGAVHIGVGPEDVEIGRQGTQGSIDRWPLLPVDELGGRLDEVESKRLEMHLARDLTTAWTFDEISYRIPGCVDRDGGYKTIVIPLRVTSLFVRDGERWVAVLEHISYPQRISELVERADGPVGEKLGQRRDPRPEIAAPIAALQRAIDPAITDADRALLWASTDDALALWPDPDQELRRGAVVSGASLAQAFDAASVELESWRFGMSPDPNGGVSGGSVAWVAATLKVGARRDRGDVTETVPLRLRASFVLEQRTVDVGGGSALQWQVVQAHVSSPVDDPILMARSVGESAASGPPTWQRPCEGTWVRPATPPQ
jgi:hypothetical protein